MMGDYLTEGAEFRCALGMQFEAKNPPHKVNVKFLTSSAVLKRKNNIPFCKVLTAMSGGVQPVPCSCPPLLPIGWKRLSKDKVKGECLLLTLPPMTPFGKCPIAPTVPLLFVKEGVNSHVKIKKGDVFVDLECHDKPPKETPTQQMSKTSPQKPNP